MTEAEAGNKLFSSGLWPGVEENMKNGKFSLLPATLFILAMALVLAPASVFADAKVPSRHVVQGMDEDLAARITEFAVQKSAELHSPGLGVGVVKGDTLIYEGYVGWADIESEKPVDEKTIFRIGSMSKSFTAIGIMQLWERGKIDLDRDANDYFPRPLIFPPHPESKPVTIRHLLTHTSGGGEFLSYRQIFMPRQGAFIKGDDYRDLEYWLRLGMKTKIDPGVNWAYCNYGYGFLGLAIEGASGEPFHQYMEKHVFLPLGMGRASFHHNDRIMEDLATGYKFRKNEYKVDKHKVTGITPAGNIYTTIEEFSLYVSAILGKGANKHGRVIKPETLEMMTSMQWTMDERQSGYGFGFRVFGNDLWGHKIFGHSGSIPFGFTSIMLFEPDERVGVYVFSNSEAYAPRDIGYGILKMTLDIDDTPPPEVTPDKSVWPELEGLYGPEQPDFKTNTRLYMYNVGRYKVEVIDGELNLYGTWSGPKKAKRLVQVFADDPYFFRVEDATEKKFPGFVSFAVGSDGVSMVPGGYNRYAKLEGVREARARMTAPMGKAISKVNPF